MPVTRPVRRNERPNQGVGNFGSLHTGGVHMGLCDGSVHFINENINRFTRENMGSRNDGSTIESF